MALCTQIATSSSSPFSSSTPPSSYDIFLSFRGKDTRFGFVDHLHKAFQQRGFIVFKDDKKLEQGSTIAEELFKAIKESQYAVVVISKTFAESKWCLNELVEILRCKKKRGLKVLPLFYHVNPANVRKKKGIFAKAFAKHQEDPEVDGEKMRAWRAALKEVADMAGMRVLHTSPEATIVEQITTTISHGLRLNPSDIFKDLVGIKYRVEELKSLVCLQSDDVRFIGIHGMSGIGKTTLARAFYNYVRYEFIDSSFVCCGKDKGSSLEKLQQQIFREILKENNKEISNHLDGAEELKHRLRNKKVFIVLDDVNRDQLKVLAGSPDWFGKGSKIVVTGTDSQLWKPNISESDIYEVAQLEEKDALELFCRKAFNRSFMENDFKKMTKQVVKSVGYLPLGLEVIGSLLCDEKIEVWESTLNDLECLEDDVFSKLKISYDGLKKLQKEMFLDMACFFVGALEVKILPIFESLGYKPVVNFEVLKKKSLIKISCEGVIWMHDLLREMGQQIVNKLFPMEPGNRSRLWCNQDIIRVLKYNSGTNAIKGVVFNSFSKSEELNFEAFSKMEKLTIFIMSYPHRLINITWVGNHCNLILSSELRVLEWLKFPLESLPGSFQANNLVKLSMQHSKINVLWHEKKTFNRLKCIDLFCSKDLREIPDLSEAPNLEDLKFGLCKSLKMVHPSIATLKKLLCLDLKFCRSLNRIPKEICWESLVHLNLSFCEKLENFPKNVGSITSLQNLNLAGTHFFSHPNYNSSHNLLSSLIFVKTLNLSYCKLLDGEFLSDFGSLSSLQNLYLDGNNFTKIPNNFYQLPQLKSLDMNSCRQLQTLPKLSLSLFDLEVVNSPLEGMDRFEMEARASVWFSLAIDGTPYKILQLNPEESRYYNFDEGDMFAWGPTLGCEVPDWFNHKSSIFFGGDVDSEELIVGIALFVAYEVGEHEYSNCSTSAGGSNPAPLELTCQFQAFQPTDHSASPEKTCLGLVCRVPEVPLIGQNGFWAFIPAEFLRKTKMYLDECHCFEISIESSWYGQATEWKSRLVHEQDVSMFFDVLQSISPQGLKLKNLKDFSLVVLAGKHKSRLK